MPSAPVKKTLVVPYHLKYHVIVHLLTTLCLLYILFPDITSGGGLAVIELEHRPADEVIPVIAPLLDPADRLSGSGYQLFLNTSLEKLTQIKAIIAHLDQSAKQVAITVVQGENALNTLQALSISGSVTIGDGITVGTGGRRMNPKDSVTIDAQNSQRATRSSDIQRVLVQDGNTATIYVGLSTPVAMASPQYQGMRYHQVVEFREMLTGVMVTPRLSGNQVSLSIETRRERPLDNQPAAVETQRVQTRVRGQLNEWIEIGGILSATGRTESGLIYGESGRQSSQKKVFVRVETIP